jgi:hypothetical protein
MVSNIEHKILCEFTYSAFLRTNFLPLDFLKESDIQENLGYMVHFIGIDIDENPLEVQYHDELSKHWISSKLSANKSQLDSKYKFGLEKISMRKLPYNEDIYLIPCKIYFNKTQSSLGFYKTPCEIDSTVDLIIYKNPGWISVLNDSESMKELGYKIIDEEFHYKLLIGIL